MHFASMRQSRSAGHKRLTKAQGSTLIAGDRGARRGRRAHSTGATGATGEARMNYRKKFIVEPGAKLRLAKIDPSYTGKHESHNSAIAEIAKEVARIDRLQYLLYADAGQSLLIVLQALDAAGKDGVIRHLFTGMNPQGTSVVGFKQPSAEEIAHDFLWRAHLPAPGHGQVVIFNRSHYEDVLVVRVHKLVPRSVWSKRYDLINGFEAMLSENRTRVLKFYLHIDPDEQLARFKQRLGDPARHWKISESDYSERELWPKYVDAYEEAIARTSTKRAPWYVIPSNHKWFRNLAVSQIVADTMEDMGLKLPSSRVDIADIRRKYHAAKRETHGDKSKAARHKKSG
jgi:PPK2 family polyphosphate:nucleotide phosphotransferase